MLEKIKHFFRKMSPALYKHVKKLFAFYRPYYDARVQLYFEDLDNLSNKKDARFIVLEKGYIKNPPNNIEGNIDINLQNNKTNSLNTLDIKVSALLITKDRPAAAFHAVQDFIAQSYPHKELVIIDEGDYQLQDKLLEYYTDNYAADTAKNDIQNLPQNRAASKTQRLDALKDIGISYHRNEKPTSLGELRNRAISYAEGEYICQWDDDDIYHPRRLEYQLSLCNQHQADACFILRKTLLGASIDIRIAELIESLEVRDDYEPLAHIKSSSAMNKNLNENPDENPDEKISRILAVSSYRLWEGTIMAKKKTIANYTYPPMSRGEDTPLVQSLVLKHRVVGLDMPNLYVYRMHEKNTWDKQHMDEMWEGASVSFSSSDEILAKLNELVAN